MWGNKPEWPFFRRKRCAIHSIRHEYIGFENPRIQFRQGEDHAITVLSGSDNVGGHRGATKLFALQNPRSVEEFLEKHTFIRFRLFVVRIHNRERFPRQLLQIGNGQDKRSGNSPIDSQFRNGRRSLRITPWNER
jgi:hypothetical protein